MSFNPKPLLGKRLNTAHPLTRGLVGCWLMNERSGLYAYDLSGNKNTMALTGTEWVQQHLYFDGTNDYGIIPQSPPINIDDHMTIIWKSKFPTQPNNFDRLFDKGDAYQLLFDDYAISNLRFDINGEIRAYPWNDITYPGDLVDDEWHILAITANTGQLYGYLDGILAGSDTYGHTGFSTTDDLHIYQRDTGANKLNADLEFFYIYNRVLSDGEIARLNTNPYAMLEDPYPIELFGYVAEVGANAPTGTIYGPLVGPLGGPI